MPSAVVIQPCRGNCQENLLTICEQSHRSWQFRELQTIILLLRSLSRHKEFEHVCRYTKGPRGGFEAQVVTVVTVVFSKVGQVFRDIPEHCSVARSAFQSTARILATHR